MSMTPTKGMTGTDASAPVIPATHGATGDPHDHPVAGDPTAALDYQAAQTICHVLSEHLTSAPGWLGTLHARSEPVDRRDAGRDQDWRVTVICQIRTPGEWRSFYQTCADVLANNGTTTTSTVGGTTTGAKGKETTPGVNTGVNTGGNAGGNDPSGPASSWNWPSDIAAQPNKPV